MVLVPEKETDIKRVQSRSSASRSTVGANSGSRHAASHNFPSEFYAPINKARR